jgi:hypothetical protein
LDPCLTLLLLLHGTPGANEVALRAMSQRHATQCSDSRQRPTHAHRSFAPHSRMAPRPDEGETEHHGD